MNKSGLALVVVLLCAVAAVANPAEIRSRIEGHLKKKEFDKAVEVANSVPSPAGRSMMLVGVAQAQRKDSTYSEASRTFAMAVEATRAIEDPNERVLRLGTLAWVYERRFENRLCKKQGGVFATAAKLLAEAGKGLAETDASAMRTQIEAHGEYPNQLHSRFVLATILHAAGSKDAAGKTMADACLAVSAIARLDVRAQLLIEAANMSRWMGDAEGGALRMRDARVYAGGIVDLSPRLGTLRKIADSYAEIGSRSGVNATMPALLAGLEELPADARDAKANWLLALAKLQSKVGAHDAIRATLNRFENAMAGVVKAYGMNPKIRKVLDEAADLRLSNDDVDGFVRYAKQRCPGTTERNEYYEQRVRWLLGLGSGKLGDFASGIGGRKPSAKNMTSGISVADAIRIASVPFRPTPGKRAASGKRDKDAERRDRLFKDIVIRGVELGHVSAAGVACARFVQPAKMADALMRVARARIKAGENAAALPLIDRAWLCLEAQAPETSKASLVEWADSALRGGNYANLARLNHDAGRTERALEVLDRVREMYKRAKQPDSRRMLASYLAKTHHEIGDAFNAKRYCAQFVEIVAARKDPFDSLLEAADTISLGGYADGARACFDRALSLADDGRVAAKTRVDRYLQLAAARNRILEDGSGDATALRATHLAEAVTDQKERDRLLNHIVDTSAGIGAPQAFLAAFHHLRPIKSEDAREATLLSAVTYLCKQGLNKRRLGVDGVRAAAGLADGIKQPRSRAAAYGAILSACFRIGKRDDLDRMLERLLAIPASDDFRPEQSISVALGELVAAYAKRHNAQLARDLRASCLSRLSNAPERESDSRLAQRANYLASLAAEEGRAGTPEARKRVLEAANAIAARISDAAMKSAALKQVAAQRA